MNTRVSAWAIVVFGLVGTASQAVAQETRPTPPQIVITSIGEVRVSPDRATISLGVQSRATTAAEAASQNSRKQHAVIDAIKAKGIAPEQITTSNFSVIPETRYDREGQSAPKTSSYLVVNSVTAEIRKIDQVGPVIDAALAVGANQVNSLTFGVTAVDSVRRVALAAAVAKSKADADVMARVAGGTIGSLLEITAMETYSPPMPVAYAMAKSEVNQSVPVEPGQQSVRATITARWSFVAQPR